MSAASARAPDAPRAEPPRTLGRAVSAQADRPSQEDRFLVWEGVLFKAPTQLYAVLDGHNGTLAADVAQRHLLPDLLRALPARTPTPHDLQHALRAAVAALEARVLTATAAARTYDGTTLCLALVRDAHLYLCNVGDSRALLARRGDDPPEQLTLDHKVRHPPERARLLAAGAILKRNRLLGPQKDLELSRALGDREFKKSPSAASTRTPPATLIPTPDISVRPLSSHDDLILLATDGLWDIPFLDNEELARIAQEELRDTRDVARAASNILEQALSFRSSDNVTLILISLRPQSHHSSSHSHSSQPILHRVQTRSTAPPDTANSTCDYWEASRLPQERKLSVVQSVSSFVRRKSSHKGARDKH